MNSQRAVFRWCCPGLIALAGLLVSGCIRDPQALIDLHRVRNAIADAKQAGAAERFPDEFAALESRHLEARGTFYACQDAKASEMANTLILDANALASKGAEAPMPSPAPAPAAPANQPPRAVLKAPSEGDVKALLRFDASGSSDPDGDTLNYHWDFGDGTTASFTFPNSVHRYAKPGNFLVRLTVKDGRGGSDSTTAPLTIVKRVVLQDREGMVFFDFDKASLKAEARQVLTDIVQEMQDNPLLRAEVIGHTDWTGSERYNLGLSRRRAESVRDFLVTQGISLDHISLDWKGESQPIKPNTTRAGRAQNRRVEIILRPLRVQ